MKDDNAKAGCGLAILAAVVLTAILSCMVTHSHRENVTGAIVLDKERVHSEGGGYYLVFTDKGTFKCADSIVENKWNSSDMYGSMQINKQYDFEVYGYRAPLFSMYQNIVLVTPHDPPTNQAEATSQ